MASLLDRSITRAPITANVGKRGWRFARHLAEMCAAMCLAWGVLGLPFFGIARLLGYADPVHDLPEVATLLAAFNMCIGMTLYMRWRQHNSRCVWEMNGAMFAEAFVLITLAGVGVIPRYDLFSWFHGLMLVAMLIPMLIRFDLYSSKPTHRGPRIRSLLGAHPDAPVEVGD
jgi:hypothetical protein